MVARMSISVSTPKPCSAKASRAAASVGAKAWWTVAVSA